MDARLQTRIQRYGWDLAADDYEPMWTGRNWRACRPGCWRPPRFVGGPVALAWSRLSEEARSRACARYVDGLAAWQDGAGYRVPGEFVIVTAVVPSWSHGAPAA